MDDKIRNLELDLVGKEENKITGYDSYSKIRGIGTEEIRHYDSEIGRIETHTFFDNYGNSKEIIANNETNINKERRDFYKQRVVPMKAFSEEQAENLFKKESNLVPKRTLSSEKANKLLKIADEVSREY